LGLPPHTAIGTDRFGIMGVCLAGWYKFHKKKLINYRVGFILTIPVIFGSFLGAHLVFEISESVLKLIIIVISNSAQRRPSWSSENMSTLSVH
jgi:uncharacterized membrane protein YfcA